jgi:hypothetical protein
MKHRLKLDPRQLLEYADRYVYPLNDDAVIEPGKDIQSRGYLTRSELQQVANWKSPRSAGHNRKNSDEYIAAVSAIPFQTDNERLRIESLTLLNRVSWPTASVILHLYHKDRYPILDFRALRSLSIDIPKQYTLYTGIKISIRCCLIASYSSGSSRESVQHDKKSNLSRNVKGRAVTIPGHDLSQSKGSSGTDGQKERRFWYHDNHQEGYRNKDKRFRENLGGPSIPTISGRGLGRDMALPGID